MVVVVVVVVVNEQSRYSGLDDAIQGGMSVGGGGLERGVELLARCWTLLRQNNDPLLAAPYSIFIFDKLQV